MAENFEQLLGALSASHVSFAWRRGDALVQDDWGMAKPGDRYDLASLTKLFTATGIFLLKERGQIAYDDPVQLYLPQFRREDVTIRHLLTHTSLLDVLMKDIRATDPTPEGIRRGICGAGKQRGSYFYQDPNYILLGWIVEQVSGLSLREFFQAEICGPLGMTQTSADPTGAVPTHGVAEVHDPSARILGGLAGHAGLFSSAQDLLKFVRMWRRGGDGLLQRETVTEALRISYESSDAHFAQCLGWKLHGVREEGVEILGGAFMHGGFTGTLCCFTGDLELVILTNFVYPGERAQEERPVFWKALAEVVQYFDSFPLQL